jgi:ribonuclease D
MTYTTYFGVEHLDKIFTATRIAFDTETLQLQPETGKLRLLQFGAESTKSIVVIDLFDVDEDGWDKIDSFLQNGEREWFAHNAVFDIGWFQECRLHLRGRVYCTMLASKLDNNGLPNLKHGLAHLAKRYLEKDISKEQQASDWSAPVLSKEQLEYASLQLLV